MTQSQGIRAIMETSKGPIKIKLFAEQVPFTVANFVNLAERGFYDGIVFHRVISNFMIQGGCPNSKPGAKGTPGTGGPGYKFGDEFVPELRHDKAGILSMANSGPNTNGSQFFITHGPTPHLNGVHSVFGAVVDAADQAMVNSIVQGDTISKITIEGDLAPLKKLTHTQVAKWDAQLDQSFPNLKKHG